MNADEKNQGPPLAPPWGAGDSLDRALDTMLHGEIPVMDETISTPRLPDVISLGPSASAVAAELDAEAGRGPLSFESAAHVGFEKVESLDALGAAGATEDREAASGVRPTAARNAAGYAGVLLLFAGLGLLSHAALGWTGTWIALAVLGPIAAALIIPLFFGEDTMRR